MLYIAFDHPLLKLRSINDVLDIYRQNVTTDDAVCCFFDEIQYSPEWNSWLKVLYDTNPAMRIMATGSASPVLAEKRRESGLGRWTTVQVPTLTFFEYCRLLNIEVAPLPDGIKPTQLYLLDKHEQGGIVNKLSFLQPHFIRHLYYRGGEKGREIDIVVQHAGNPRPVMIEVKYREDSSISEKDMIVELSACERPNLVITKRPDDFGLREYEDGKRIYKIPAPVFLYLLGHVDSQGLESPA